MMCCIVYGSFVIKRLDHIVLSVFCSPKLLSVDSPDGSHRKQMQVDWLIEYSLYMHAMRMTHKMPLVLQTPHSRRIW